MVKQNAATRAPEDDSTSGTTATSSETLNFKVTTRFKKEFKGYAVSQGMTMIELLREGFELSKRERNG